MSTPPEPRSIFDPALRGTTLTILTLVALSAFEGLAVSAALPQLAASLGSVELLPWVVTSYLLFSGVATVAAGALVDRHGIAPVFRASVILFIVGSLICGIAPSMGVLVLGRSVQGIGAGAINAVGLTAVGLIFPRKLVGRAFAANANVWGIMSVAGPAIAALMLTVASWRWIFLVNLPLGGLALWVGWTAMPGRRDAADGRRLPTIDLSLLIIFSLLALLTVDAMDWRSALFGVGAVIAGASLLRRGRGRADALLAPRHVMRAPLGPLSWGVAAILVGGIGTQTFVPLFVSGGRGISAALTAWTVLFFVIGWTSGANLSSRALDRVPAPKVIRFSVTVVPVALVGVGLCALGRAPLPVMFALLFVAGLGTGAVTNATLTLVREYADDAELGRATAAHQFMRNFGFILGNALVGAVLLLVVAAATGDVEQIRSVLGEHSGALEVKQAVAAAIERGFGVGALVAAGVALLGALLLWRLGASPKTSASDAAA